MVGFMKSKVQTAYKPSEKLEALEWWLFEKWQKNCVLREVVPFLKSYRIYHQAPKHSMHIH